MKGTNSTILSTPSTDGSAQTLPNILLDFCAGTKTSMTQFQKTDSEI